MDRLGHSQLAGFALVSATLHLAAMGVWQAPAPPVTSAVRPAAATQISWLPTALLQQPVQRAPQAMKPEPRRVERVAPLQAAEPVAAKPVAVEPPAVTTAEPAPAFALPTMPSMGGGGWLRRQAAQPDIGRLAQQAAAGALAAAAQPPLEAQLRQILEGMQASVAAWPLPEGATQAGACLLPRDASAEAPCSASSPDQWATLLATAQAFYRLLPSAAPLALTWADGGFRVETGPSIGSTTGATTGTTSGTTTGIALVH